MLFSLLEQQWFALHHFKGRLPAQHVKLKNVRHYHHCQQSKPAYAGISEPQRASSSPSELPSWRTNTITIRPEDCIWTVRGDERLRTIGDTPHKTVIRLLNIEFEPYWYGSPPTGNSFQSLWISEVSYWFSRCSNTFNRGVLKSDTPNAEALRGRWKSWLERRR